MTQRHELQRLHASLTDIGGLMDAMKNIARVECRSIGAFIEAQTSSAAIIEAAFADFAQDHPAEWPVTVPERDVWVVIGSERGLCGDLNRRLAETVASLRQSKNATLVLVGSQLGQRCTASDGVHVTGAQFAEEGQGVLLKLLSVLPPLLRPVHGESVGLKVLYVGDAGVHQRDLLPVPRVTGRGSARSHPVLLYLRPRDYLAALLQQWLAAALGCALYDALLHENLMRLEHMDQVRNRIDDRLASLKNQVNVARQEEITEEIELLQLSVAMDKA